MKSRASQIIASATMRGAPICSVALLAALGGGSNWAWADPGMQNLAAGKIATATRSDFGGTPEKGVDGNRDGDFGHGSVFYGNADPTPGATSYFYQVDLGQNSYVNRIQFLPRTDADQNVFGPINISLYPDDGTGNPAATPSFSQDYNTSYFGNSFATSALGAAAPGGANGRFARITRLDNNYWLTFAEMEVIGSPVALQYTEANNLASNKVVTTSSAPGFGALIISGNDSNISGDFNDPNRPVYHSSDHSIGEYWQVDLGADTPLSHAELFARAGKGQNTTSQFNVQVYDSSMNLVDSVIVDNSDVDGPTPGYDHTIDLIGDTGRYIRVSTTTDSFLSFAELEAFGVAPGWATHSGDWTVATNWGEGTVPNAANATALFARPGNAIQTVTNNSPITVGTLRFNSTNSYVIAGTGSLTLDASGTALIDVLQGNQTINLPTTFASNTNVNVVSGTTLKMSAPVTVNSGVNVTQGGTGTVLYESSVSVLGGGSLTFGNSNHLTALNLASAAKASMTPRNSQAKLLQVDNLNMASNATLDLNDNDLVVSNGTGMYTQVRAWVIQGLGAGTTGIDSSTSTGSTRLALFDNALQNVPSWNGVTIAANAIVGKYTYFGDVNIDGQVTGDDYTVVDSNLNTTPPVGLEWVRGDANADLTVTGDDYTVIDANLGSGVGNPLGASALGGAAVPEPAGVGIIVLSVALASLRQRRRRQAGEGALREPERVGLPVKVSRPIRQE